MLNIPESMNFASMDQQFVHLRGILEEMQAYLLKARIAAIPPQFYDDIYRMAEGLSKMRNRMNLLEAERQNLRALAEIGNLVNSTLNLEMVLKLVMDTIIRVTGAERAFLMLGGSGDEMVIRMARNYVKETLSPTDIAISHTIVNRVLATGNPVITTNAQEDPRFRHQESVLLNELRSILCVPLKLKDQIMGVVYADHRMRIDLFNRRDLDLLFAYTGQAAVAIENARLFESVQRSLAEVTQISSLMDNVLESITIAVLALDADGVITVCNPAAGALLGTSYKEMVGQRLVDINPGLVRALQGSLMFVLASEQPIIDHEIVCHLPKGLVDLRFSLSPLKNSENESRGLTIVLEDLTEIKSLESKRRLFERMLSPALVEQLDPDSLPLSGRRQEITILFADLRDFTHFSDGMAPEELTQILNRYLAAAADAVLHETGTVDKFLGDAVMAWFNAPVPQADHALRAVRTGLGIRAAIQKLHREMPPRFRMSFGVGIHVGEAVLGLIGSERRLEYTAIGDSVNTARRIQENAGPGQILISQQTYNCVSTQVKAIPVEPIQAKGKRELIPVYEVIDLL